MWNICICLKNLYPKLPSAPSMSQESFNIETIRKYYQDITDLKSKYNEKQWKYKKLTPIYYMHVQVQVLLVN